MLRPDKILNALTVMGNTSFRPPNIFCHLKIPIVSLLFLHTYNVNMTIRTPIYAINMIKNYVKYGNIAPKHIGERLFCQSINLSLILPL